MRKLLAFLAALVFSLSAFGAQPGKTFPFTQEQNQDGAKFVWFIFGDSGFKYDYVPAKDLPNSPNFRQVSEPQPGDMAWWSGYVAIVNLHDGKLYSYRTAESERMPDEIESLYGKPRFYRYVVRD